MEVTESEETNSHNITWEWVNIRLYTWESDMLRSILNKIDWSSLTSEEVDFAESFKLKLPVAKARI